MSLKMSESPYQRSPRTTLQIMLELTGALLIVWLAAVIYYFTLSTELGVKAILLVVVALVVTAAIDALVAIIRHKKGGNLLREILDSVIHNYSYVTAIIFTLCCPVYVSYYVIVIGCLVSTGIKHCFGGFGKNIFNPAIIGRIFTGLCFAGQFNIPTEYVDLMSSATVTTQYSGLGVKWLSSALPEGFNLGTLLLGNYVGAMGETFTILILVLGVILAIRNVINWRSTAFYLGTVAITALFISFFVDGLNPFTYTLYHLCLGGLAFGAVFMITDPVTSPTSPFGKALIGVIAGFLTVLIRIDGNNPEGVMYSIAIINIIAPMIDRLIVGRTTDGHAKKWATIGGLVAVSIVVNTAICVGSAKTNENSSSSTSSSLVGSTSSSTSVELSREEKLFGYTAEVITLGTLPSETNIVKTYKLTGEGAPTAIGYELKHDYTFDAHGYPQTIDFTLGVTISLTDDKIVSVKAIDSYVSSPSFAAAVDTFMTNLAGKDVNTLLDMTHTSGEGHSGCSDEDIDFVSGSTISEGEIFNLVVEASKQYINTDKNFYLFGDVANVTSYTISGTSEKISAAYIFEKEGVQHVGYIVNDPAGIEIDMHFAVESIYPSVLVVINTTTDTIESAKVLGLPTTSNYTSFAGQLETLVANFAGKTVEEINALSTPSDTVANATYSSKGLFNYVKVACSQYATNDKAVLNGGAD